jgi:predicted peroxiredoxin
MATILYVGTAGSDDPTRAGFPFNFALGAIEAGHQAEIFLAGEAAYLMRT